MDNAEGDERSRKLESQWRLWRETAGEEERNVAEQVRAGEAESSGGASDGPATGPRVVHGRDPPRPPHLSPRPSRGLSPALLHLRSQYASTSNSINSLASATSASGPHKPLTIWSAHRLHRAYEPSRPRSRRGSGQSAAAQRRASIKRDRRSMSTHLLIKPVRRKRPSRYIASPEACAIPPPPRS